MSDKQGNGFRRIAIIGGGPSGLFMYKRLIDSGRSDFEIDIFERKSRLGAGMPYSTEGANDEHVTNVSDNEIPNIVTSIQEWVKTAPQDLLNHFKINSDNFNEYKVLPRLFFGEYLTAQFDLLLAKAVETGITTRVHLNANIEDITANPSDNVVEVRTDGKALFFDTVIISTGHNWPRKYEGKVPGYYDSPYPPSKLAYTVDHTVALKGSSLTAIDALKTLARSNGSFITGDDGRYSFMLKDGSKGFKVIMHTRNGLLPAVRFHLDDTHLKNKSILTDEQIAHHIAQNNGFLSLDYIFEQDFKEPIKLKDPEFYNSIKELNLEEFVGRMMDQRQDADAFKLLEQEYVEAEKSIRKHQSVYWKEMLGVLSFALNYPAKHLSAEDMLRLQKTLMPLISVVIAYIPQGSCRELMALHNAGILSLVGVGGDSYITPDEQGATYHYTDEKGVEQARHFDTFIDCSGQPHLSYTDFPFKGLLNNGAISQAKLKFRSEKEGELAMAENDGVTIDSDGRYSLNVAGITRFA